MRKISYLFLFLLLAPLSFAQQATVSNVLNLKTAQHSGVILQQNKLVGYYIFYLKEKVDKDNNAYEVELFDDNYNSSGTFEIIRPKSSVLAEMVYNGQNFMLHFFDKKTGYEFATYDRDGNEVGSSNIPRKEISNWDLTRLEQNYSSATENVTIYPNSTEGFIRNTFTKNKKIGYEIVAYDNSSNQTWSYASKENSEMIETADINEVTNGILTVTVAKKKNLMTKDVRYFCLLLNANDGSLIREFELGSEAEGQRSLLKSFYNDKKNTITIVGEYFKKGDDIIKSKSEGLYVKELSETGEELDDKKYAWKGDIDQFAGDVNSDGKKERPFYVYFHDVVISKNGHIFLIGEQFIKQVSAGGVALNVLASATGGQSNASMFEILIADMVVVELDEKKELVDFKLIDKKNTSVLLSQGYGLVSTAVLGYYMKAAGQFDYAFTSRNKEKDVFDVVYIDADRKESKDSKTRSDLMVGLINIKGGKMNNTRVPINCESKFWWIQPAKPGFISISEYNRKAKEVKMRLEPLSY